MAVSGAGTRPCTCSASPAARPGGRSGIAAFVPDSSRQAVSVVGAANGDGLDPVEPCWFVEPADPGLSFVDLQRDVTVADLRRATGTGMRSVEHVKRYTTAGTAQDQGKTSGVLASAVVAAALDRDVAKIGTTTYRGPYTPVAFATLAGRAGGDLLDPVRVTSIHQWHVEHGAAFENVGQWKRPWFYARAGEDLDAAVLRECAARAHGVGVHGRVDAGQDRGPGPGCSGVPGPAVHQPDLVAQGRLDPLRPDGQRRRHDLRRRHGDAPGRRPVPGHDDDRQRRRRARLVRGMAADRVAAPAGLVHLGDRAVGHGRGGRARGRATCWPSWPPNWPSTTRASRS